MFNAWYYNVPSMPARYKILMTSSARLVLGNWFFSTGNQMAHQMPACNFKTFKIEYSVLPFFKWNFHSINAHLKLTRRKIPVIYLHSSRTSWVLDFSTVSFTWIIILRVLCNSCLRGVGLSFSEESLLLKSRIKRNELLRTVALRSYQTT